VFPGTVCYSDILNTVNVFFNVYFEARIWRIWQIQVSIFINFIFHFTHLYLFQFFFLIIIILRTKYHAHGNGGKSAKFLVAVNYCYYTVFSVCIASSPGRFVLSLETPNPSLDFLLISTYYKFLKLVPLIYVTYIDKFIIYLLICLNKYI